MGKRSLSLPWTNGDVLTFLLTMLVVKSNSNQGDLVIGILRDRSLAKMTDDDWKLVVDVHLNGVYKCSRAAWTHMLKQGYGRIVNVSSVSLRDLLFSDGFLGASGLYGNYGQVNYSMAKSGILGMTKTMAIEGKKRGNFSP